MYWAGIFMCVILKFRNNCWSSTPRCPIRMQKKSTVSECTDVAQSWMRHSSLVSTGMWFELVWMGIRHKAPFLNLPHHFLKTWTFLTDALRSWHTRRLYFAVGIDRGETVRGRSRSAALDPFSYIIISMYDSSAFQPVLLSCNTTMVLLRYHDYGRMLG